MNRTVASTDRLVSVGSAHPLGTAVLTLAVWTGVTYALEGARLTLLRPDATIDRLVYAVVANILVGTVVAVWVVHRLSRADADRLVGFRRPMRTLVGVGVAGALGAVLYLSGSPPTTDPVVLANAFVQTLVVSIAEVVVCWVLLGVAVERALRPRVGRRLAGVGLVVSASVAFGLYHVAHSPPFNTPAMIGLLTGVGVLTSLVFLASRDLYATLVFHNVLAVTGVTRALAEAGALGTYTAPLPALWLTALLAVVTLVGVDYWLIRRPRSTE